MNQSDDELTPAERGAIEALPREAPPPASLEDATVAALRARGLLGSPRSPSRRPIQVIAGLAAAAALFLGGLLLGRSHPAVAETASPGPRFVLLLYEGPDYTQPAVGQDMERVREYGAWARAHAAKGEIEGGEKLKDAREIVVGDGGETTAPAGPGGTRLAGFFLIRASDDRSALAIARTCPHLRYGGSIVIREIEPT